MRAILQRDTQAATNTYGAKAPPSWVTQNAELPCYLYSRTIRPTRIIDGRKSVTVEQLICMVPKGTDVVPGDRIFSVVNRLGVTIHATPIKIRGVQDRYGRGHIELTLEDAST